MKITVILLYPPLPLAPDTAETYYGFVDEETFPNAVKAAQREAFYRLAPSDRRGSSPRRFTPVAAFEGHRQVFNPSLSQLIPQQPP